VRTPYQAISRFVTLSHTQRKILRIMSRGFTVDGIAEELGISRHTVRTHYRTIYKRLGVTCREEVFALILKHMMSGGSR